MTDQVLVRNLGITDPISDTVKDVHSQRIMQENALEERKMSHHGGETGKKERVRRFEMGPTSNNYINHCG